MKPLYKLMLREMLLRGTLFATIMALFDYFNDESFSLLKFAVNGFGFGLFMALFSGYSYRKNQRREQNLKQ